MKGTGEPAPARACEALGVTPSLGLDVPVTIARVEAVPFTFWHDREPLSYCLVRVEGDDGTVGWGEACDSFGCTWASVVQTLVADALGPLAVGEPADPAAVTHKLRSWTRRRLGEQWVTMQAVSGIELAVWDLLGRARGESVATMLGTSAGRAAHVPVYASSVFLEEGSVDWHLSLLGPCLAGGVGAVKFRIGLDWARDLETLAGLCEELTPGVEVMVDGNENYTVATALAIADRLAELGIGWFEEPVPQSDRAAIEEVVRRSPVPIAYGEHLFGVGDFDDAVRHGQAGVLQPDPATCGGLVEARRIAEAGLGAGRRVVPHSAAGPVALAAALHLAAATPGLEMVECPYPLAECWQAVAPASSLSPADLVDGALPLPAGPGFGIEVDEGRVRSLPYQAPGPRSGPSPRSMGAV
jgi:L-alanine-DL-glutamate epimerase-like enolase superfamily enzyme